jgi:hypothetical protein
MPRKSLSDAYPSMKGFSTERHVQVSDLLKNPEAFVVLEGESQDLEDEKYLTQVKLRETPKYYPYEIKRAIQKLFHDCIERGLNGKLIYCSPNVQDREVSFKKDELVEEFDLEGEDEKLLKFSKSFLLVFISGYEKLVSDNVAEVSALFYCNEAEAKGIISGILYYIENEVLYPNKYDYESRKTTLDHITKELKLSSRYEVLILSEKLSRGEDITGSDIFLSLPRLAQKDLISKFNLNQNILFTVNKEESDKLEAQMDALLRSGNKQYRYYLPLLFLLDPIYLDERGEDNREKLRKLLKIDKEKEEAFFQKLEKNGKIERVGDLIIVIETEEAEALLKEVIEGDQLDFDILIRTFV